MQDRYDDANAGDPLLLRPCEVDVTADLLQWNLSNGADCPDAARRLS